MCDWDDELSARASEASYENAAEKLGIYSFLAHGVLDLVDHDYPIRQAVNDTLDAVRELADELGVSFREWDDFSNEDEVDPKLQAASKYLFDNGLDAIGAVLAYERATFDALNQGATDADS